MSYKCVHFIFELTDHILDTDIIDDDIDEHIDEDIKQNLSDD